MSIPFTQLNGADAELAGYFRLGHVVFKLPPTDILTNFVSSKERIATLRGSNDMVKFTGRGRWDATVRWTSMLDDTATTTVGRFAQWQDLRNIVAIFKAAPFVEVENSYLRQLILEHNGSAPNSMRMAFGLRQLRISTHPDIIDAFDCSLTMTWFNYYPYSLDFGYLSSNGQSTDANMSDLFADPKTGYIATWIAKNMDAAPGHLNDLDVPTTNWQTLNPGTVKFKWREYRTIKYSPLVVTNNAAATANGGTLTFPNKQGALTIARNSVSTANAVGAALNVAPYIIYAQWAFETGGFNNTGATEQNNLAGIRPSGASTGFRTFSSLSEFGNSYVSLIKRKYSQCIGATSIAQYGTGLEHGGIYPSWSTSATTAEYVAGMQVHQNDYFKYLALGPLSPDPSSVSQAQSLKNLQPNLDSAAKSFSANPTPTSTNTSTSSVSSLDKLYETLSKDDQMQIQQMVDNGWKVDYWSNDLIYMYVGHELTYANSDQSDEDITAAADTIGMIPNNISILMVNNIAQIPLASFAYPTYQHIGSASSQLAIGFISTGADNGSGDPIHAGAAMLGGVATFLDNQYLAFRNNWRRVDSVHRIQAVYVENQMLNMLGIRGITLDNLSTETIPDSANQAQVGLTASQYENIFESTPPFSIRTISEAASGVTQSIINSGALSTLDPSEQQVIPTVNSFSKGRSTGDLNTLSSFLLDVGSQATNDFGVFSTLQSMTPSSDQSTAMLQLINTTPLQNQQQENSDTITNSIISPGLASITNPTDIASNNVSTYPPIAKRLQSVQNSGAWTVGDVCLIYALATNNPAAQQASYSLLQANSLLQNDITGIQSVYDAIFPLVSSSDPTFASEINSLSNSPAFASQYNSAYDAQGPALSKENNDAEGSHASYKAMGLTSTYTSTGADYTPAYYFNNYSILRQQTLRQEVEQVVNGASNTASTVNEIQNVSEYSIAITDSDFTGINKDVDSLIATTNLPGLSMAEAFPTFKLFLMEDESDGIINCFDNFYSYASVTELEIIRYRDQPDAAVIQITNISNLLMHHLFDDTLMGRYAYGLNQWRNPVPSDPSETGDTGSLIGGRTLSGQTYMLDLSNGFVPGQKKRVPLQYVAMKPGSKIQIRMGYSNNPDLLTPVFTGRVTKLDPDGDMLVVTAESYLGELCSLPVYDGTPLASKTFGKEWTNADSGDGPSVVEKLLETDSAKHFGGLKLATATDTMVTGMTWTQRTGKSIGEFGLGPTNIITEIGAAMASSYDRTGENISVNHVTDYTGVPVQSRNTPAISTRKFEDTSSTSMYLSFNYSVKDNSTFTTWDLIKDVCRRYPEYNVCCKQYGFPYSADATLVIAHPLDWYFARQPMIGDAETYRTGPQAVALWGEWWKTGGKETWDSTLSSISSIGIPVTLLNISYPTDPSSFELILQQTVQKLLLVEGAPPNSGNSILDAFELALGAGIAALYVGGIPLSLPFGGPNPYAQLKSIIGQAIADINALRKAWYNYVRLHNPKAADRLKPVRKYHYIDEKSIIHNGLRLNEKIYNSIKVANTTVNANDHIPPHYRRVLDVTALMNYPEKNVIAQAHNVSTLIAQSYLRDEVGKMYSGEIVLRSTPDIEPYDCLIILDPSTAMSGIVEVDKVIHSYTMENGAITIVYPRALVAINEAASAGLGRMLQMVFAKTLFKFNGITPHGGLLSAWNSVDSTTAKTALGVSEGVGVLGAALGLGALAGPPGWITVLLASGMMLGGVLAVGWEDQKSNNIEILPMTKHGTPWIGGLEGYQLTDFWGTIASNFTEWEVDNIYPLIQLYRTYGLHEAGTLPIQPN
jgi:hypothetical protein